jgi:hypothetical protein
MFIICHKCSTYGKYTKKEEYQFLIPIKIIAASQ